MRKRPRFIPCEPLGTQQIHVLAQDSLVEGVRDFALRNNLKQENAVTILLSIALQAPKQFSQWEFDELGNRVEHVRRYKGDDTE